jgi:hypothetical protein
MRNAKRSEDLTQASLICESLIAEIASGVVPATSVVGQPVDWMPDENGDVKFLYTTNVAAVDGMGLLQVDVTVTSDSAYSVDPVSCTLSRWIVDPDYAASVQEAADAAASAAAGTAGTGGGTNNAAGGMTGMN